MLRLVALALSLAILMRWPVHPTTIVITGTTTVHTPATTIVVPFTRPVVLPVTTDHRVCPAPRGEAGPVEVEPPDDELTRIRAAPSDARWVAAWNEQHIYVSTDAGAHWTRTLDGPGQVHDVTFDCFGDVIAVRGNQLGVATTADAHWHKVRGISIGDDPRLGVVGGGPDVVVVGNTRDRGDTPGVGRIAISHDLGETWRFHDLDDPFDRPTVSGRQDADGTVHAAVALPDCMNDDVYWAVVENGKLAIDRLGVYEGASYAVAGDTMITGYDWRRRGEEWKKIIGLPIDEQYYERITIEGPTPTVLDHGTAFAIRNGTAHALPWKIRGESISMDLAGRVWSVVGGKPTLAR